jgi:hypothetical protein
MRLFFAFFACFLPVFAQNWATVQGLGAGSRVKVREVGGVEHRGTVTAVTPDSISLGTVSLERTKVDRVQVHTRSRRPRNIAIGAAIGLAVAVTIDQTLGTRLRNEGGGGGRAITYIAPIGLFGALGAFIQPYKTIYRAP